jgi:hypothetical protein
MQTSVIDLSINSILGINDPYPELTESFYEIANIPSDVYGVFIPELFVEAQVNPPGSTWQNTKAVTKDTIKGGYAVLKNTTDAGGGILKAIWDLYTSFLSLITRLLRWISLKLVNLPNALTKLFRGLEKLPGNIAAKIRGDIALYITNNDLGVFDTLEGHITDYLMRGEEFIKGVDFGSNRGVLPTKKTQENKLYFKKMTQMKQHMNAVKNIRFEKTNIPTSDKSVVEIYLNPNSDYYKKLQAMIKWFKDQEPKLVDIHKQAEEKLGKARVNGGLDKLDTHDLASLREFIADMGTMVKIMGSLGKCVVGDVQTISGSTEAILQKLGITITTDNQQATNQPASNQPAEVKQETPKTTKPTKASLLSAKYKNGFVDTDPSHDWGEFQRWKQLKESTYVYTGL